MLPTFATNHKMVLKSERLAVSVGFISCALQANSPFRSEKTRQKLLTMDAESHRKRAQPFPDSGDKEVCRDGGRSSNQEDRPEGDSNAEGAPMFANRFSTT